MLSFWGILFFYFHSFAAAAAIAAVGFVVVWYCWLYNDNMVRTLLHTSMIQQVKECAEERDTKGESQRMTKMWA